MENFVDAARVADYLAYKNVESVYRLVARGGLPCVRLNGQLRFRLTDVERWLTGQDNGGQAAVIPLTERRTA